MKIHFHEWLVTTMHGKNGSYSLYLRCSLLTSSRPRCLSNSVQMPKKPVKKNGYLFGEGRKKHCSSSNSDGILFSGIEINLLWYTRYAVQVITLFMHCTRAVKRWRCQLIIEMIFFGEYDHVFHTWILNNNSLYIQRQKKSGTILWK